MNYHSNSQIQILHYIILSIILYGYIYDLTKNLMTIINNCD